MARFVKTRAICPLTAFGTPVEIFKLFGGKQNYLAAVREQETALYSEAA